MRKLQSCECTELLMSFIKRSDQICRNEKMGRWAFSYGTDSDVYKTITQMTSDDEKHYYKLEEIIKNSCPSQNEIAQKIKSLECGCG